MKQIKMLVAILGIVTLTSSAKAQDEKFAMSAQASQSFIKTPFSDVSILAGFSTGEGNRILAGPSYRRLYGDVGHSSNYYGATLYTQAGIFYPVHVALKFDFMYGDWHKEEMYTNKYVLSRNVEMIGTVLVGYYFDKRTSLSAGYSPFTYDPQTYVKTGESAFQRHSVAISLKRDIL